MKKRKKEKNKPSHTISSSTTKGKYQNTRYGENGCKIQMIKTKPCRVTIHHEGVKSRLGGVRQHPS